MNIKTLMIIKAVVCILGLCCWHQVSIALWAHKRCRNFRPRIWCIYRYALLTWFAERGESQACRHHSGPVYLRSACDNIDRLLSGMFNFLGWGILDLSFFAVG
jgi:hypothetical protein